MNQTVPLLAGLPLVGAAILAGVGRHLPRRVVEIGAVLVATATTVLAFVVLVDARSHEVIHWFGGWRPSHGHTLGIAFTANALDAATACTVGVVSVAALAFAIGYFEEAGHLFQVLMLTFLGGMMGFAVTGDLFNLFVFFELMSVAGFALCGYRIERESVLQGSLNFAVLNTIGGFFVLMGIALVYARTGALNMAQIGDALSRTRGDATVGIAFALLLVGFLVKAGSVPFHFWLSDAYAVAAAPAGALFAAVMSDLGYHAVARVYWKCFSGVLGADATAIRDMLLVVGATTAVVGAVTCFLQADVKRQLAFLVISHGGVFLCGIALLTADGLAASTVYLVTDAGFKGAVFLALGLTVARLGGSNELALHSRGRHRRLAPIGIVLLVAALGLAAAPGLGTWRGAAMLARAADDAGFPWLPPLIAATTAVTAAALLRAYARVFLGWGRSGDAMLAGEPDPQIGGDADENSTPPLLLIVVPMLLLVATVVAGALPGIEMRAASAAVSFVDLRGYVGEVLHETVPPPPTVAFPGPGLLGLIYGLVTTIAACLLAALALWQDALPRAVRRTAATLTPGVRLLRRAHSGSAGDYTVWLTGGAAVVCVTLLAMTR